MKTVAILSNYINTLVIPPLYIFPHQKLTRMFRDSWIELRRVSIHSFDKEKWVFLDYVDMDKEGNFVTFHEEYRPDVIWNRSWDNWHFYTYNIFEKAWIPIFPSSKVIWIDSDKYEMFLFLEKYQPISLLLKDFFESETSRNKLGEKLVLKPIRSFWWHGIEFYTQQELLENANKYIWLESLYVVQEFKDFSKWIPWLTSNNHDIRLVYIWWKYSHTTMRMPAKWWLKSNVWSGWSKRFLYEQEIPKALFSLGENVLKDLDLSDNSILSIDFWYVLDEDRWYVFEINSSPWVYFCADDEKMANDFYNAYFVDLINFFNTKYFNN